MRTQTITIYRMIELSDEAKQRAIEEYRNSYREFFQGHEIVDTIKEFAHALGIKIVDYSLGDYRSNKIDWTGEVTKTQARQAYKNLTKKFIETCPLTGVCYDMDILEAFKDALKNSTIDEAIDKAFKEMIKVYMNEIEHFESDEYIIEEIEGNDMEFTKDGSLV